MNYIYSAPEFEKYKQDDFVNTIYEIIGGTYVKYLDEINNNNLRTNEMHAYIFVTMNYVTEIVTLYSVSIDVKSIRCFDQFSFDVYIYL